MSTCAKTLAFKTKKFKLIRKGLTRLYPTSKPSLAYIYWHSKAHMPLLGLQCAAPACCLYLTLHFSRTQHVLSLDCSPSSSPPTLSHLHGFAFTASSTHQSRGFPQALSNMPWHSVMNPFLIFPVNVELPIVPSPFGFSSTLAHETICFISVLCSPKCLPQETAVFSSTKQDYQDVHPQDKREREPTFTFHAKMGSVKDRNDMDLTEAEDFKKRWQEYTEELYKKDLHDPDNHDGVITYLEPDILECEVKWP